MLAPSCLASASVLTRAPLFVHTLPMPTPASTMTERGAVQPKQERFPLGRRFGGRRHAYPLGGNRTIFVADREHSSGGHCRWEVLPIPVEVSKYAVSFSPAIVARAAFGIGTALRQCISPTVWGDHHRIGRWSGPSGGQ